MPPPKPLSEQKKEAKIAIEQQPNFSEAHRLLDAVFTRQGELEKAIAELKIALIQQPDYLWAKKTLEDTLRLQQEPAGAKRQAANDAENAAIKIKTEPGASDEILRVMILMDCIIVGK